MSSKTDIQWCDSTVNPTGFQCDGCELWLPKANPPVKKCYAGRWAERIGGAGAFDKPIELKPGRMAKAAAWSDLRGQPRPDKPWIPASYPRLIFIGDMADTFSAGVPFEFLKKEVVDVVRGWPHIGLWLTKRPKRIAEFSRWLKVQFNETWPCNLWPGTSVTSNQTLSRAAQLLQVECGQAKRFLSIEPLWEPLSTEQLSSFFVSGFLEPAWIVFNIRRENDYIQWVIVGAESGPQAEVCGVHWINGVASICQSYGAPCFVKQLGAKPVLWTGCQFDEFPNDGKKITFKDSKGGDWSEWPENLRIRNFPKLDL